MRTRGHNDILVDSCQSLNNLGDLIHVHDEFPWPRHGSNSREPPTLHMTPARGISPISTSFREPTLLVWLGMILLQYPRTHRCRPACLTYDSHIPYHENTVLGVRLASFPWFSLLFVASLLAGFVYFPQSKLYFCTIVVPVLIVIDFESTSKGSEHPSSYAIHGCPPRIIEFRPPLPRAWLRSSLGYC